MLVTRFDPFREIRALEKRLFDRGYDSENNENVITGFSPAVNTREGEFAYHVEVDLPGVKKEDINIDVDKNILTISGEKKTKEEIKEDDYYKVESTFGKFQRSFTLPETADIENITASSKDGVLEVVIPKLKELVEKKKIAIA